MPIHRQSVRPLTHDDYRNAGFGTSYNGLAQLNAVAVSRIGAIMVSGTNVWSNPSRLESRKVEKRVHPWIEAVLLLSWSIQRGISVLDESTVNSLFCPMKF